MYYDSLSEAIEHRKIGNDPTFANLGKGKWYHWKIEYLALNQKNQWAFVQWNWFQRLFASLHLFGFNKKISLQRIKPLVASIESGQNEKMQQLKKRIGCLAKVKFSPPKQEEKNIPPSPRSPKPPSASDEKLIEQVKKNGGTIHQWISHGTNTFQGIDWLKQCHSKQLEIFDTWAGANQWDRIRHAHYDWWMFPIESPANQTGYRYTIGPSEAKALRADEEFMAKYRKGIELVMAAYGWDVRAQRPHSNGELVDVYSIRIKKIAQSLLYLHGPEQKPYYESLTVFVDYIMQTNPGNMSDITYNETHKVYPE